VESQYCGIAFDKFLGVTTAFVFAPCPTTPFYLNKRWWCLPSRWNICYVMTRPHCVQFSLVAAALAVS